MSVRFSVVMPVYNREPYLRQALDSVLSQTFTDYEVIAVDDGSTDRSLEILKSYGSRIQVIAQKNSGPEVARNAGVAVAQGEYVALLDSDDFFFPYTLQVYDRVLRAFNSPPVVVGSQFYYRDVEPVPQPTLVTGAIEVLKYQDILSKTVSLSIMSSLYVIRRSVYQEIRGFRNSTAQTWWGDIVDFVLKLGTHGPFVLIQSPFTTAYRMHATNSTKSLVSHANGMLEIARAERQGRYPGGPERRSDRYALLGGICGQWAWSYCWRGGERKTALRLLFGAAPMIAVASWRKFWRLFAPQTQPMILPAESAAPAPAHLDANLPIVARNDQGVTGNPPAQS